jgi:hypothetical protein
MRKVKISIEDLIEAFENCSFDVQGKQRGKTSKIESN